jgi:hypothetical protein
MLVSSFVFLFALLLTCAVGVGSKIVQLSSPLMIFVVRSVVVSGGHH